MTDLMFGDFSHEETEKFFGRDKQCVKVKDPEFPWGAETCINPTIEFGFDVPQVAPHVCSYYPSYHSSSCNGSSHQESSSALTSPPYSSKSSSVENFKISSVGQKSSTNNNHHHHHHRHSLSSAKKKKQRPKDYYAREYNQIMEPSQEQQQNGILNDNGSLSATTLATPTRSTTVLGQSSSNATAAGIDQLQHSEFQSPPVAGIIVSDDARLLACNQWVDSTMKHQQQEDDQESSKQSIDLTNDEDENDSDDTHGTTTDDNEDSVTDDLQNSRSTTIPQTNASYPINIAQTNNNLNSNTLPTAIMKTYPPQQLNSLSPALNDDVTIYSTSVASGASVETLKPNVDQNNIKKQSSLVQSIKTKNESAEPRSCWADLFRSSSKNQTQTNSNNLTSPPSSNKDNNTSSITKSLSSASSSTSQPPTKKPQQTLVRSSSGTQISSLTSQPMPRSTTANDNRLYNNQSKNHYHVYNSSGGESQSLDDYFSKCELRPSAMAIKPRGLVNKGNYCYINATLQALLACPPFFNVMKHAPISDVPAEQIMPCIEALHVFVNKFEKMDRSKYPISANHKDIVCGQPFEATNMLSEIARLRKSPLDVVKTKQEDAHELLCQLLSELHEEICNILYKTPVPPNYTEEQSTSATQNSTTTTANNVSQTNGNDEKSEDWLQVGKRNRTHSEIRKSLISEIFAGMFRSTVHSAGNQRSVVHEPFFTLSLEIKDSRIQSLEDALLRFSEQSVLTDYVDNKTRQTVHTSKTILIDQLPPILIIHLKCFLYDETDNSAKKINKQLSYQVNLTLPSKILTEQAKKTSYDRYKLFAVEYHCGDKASGGHYVTDVFHPGLQGWIRMDDSTVNVVTSSQVLNSQDNKQTPYLLFYRRGD
ncbi:unnamed protein product [Didymodactylos carnosus]|uniref:Ubiquitin carboxyl-terminal hydrolase n=1 Tax=Didymodactylos carnosus TaxID=1234261 RepID=A0A814MNT4_9BILA|nr:unnamed protein product [Didymodactylos carnosus]CAF3847049.1 unnamed protein product [Didymodactylos carnosus]